MLIGLLPTFNEKDSIISVLNKLEKQLDYIIIINDGSFDNTGTLISDWVKNRENIHYISFKKNKGMSYALWRGFNYICEQYKKGKFSSKDLVITIDADNQHNPNEINSMHTYFNNNNLDILIAQRDFSKYPKYRIMGNRLMSKTASCLGKFKFRDIECGFKMMKIAFIENLLNYYIGYRYSCAGEIGIAASLLGYKLDNNYKIQVGCYRKRGPNFLDLFINLVFYFLISVKIKFYLYTKKSPKARYSISVE
jgi:dolichol-phosphate mannosyltransferase